jgi:hypothetical protein
MAQQEIQGSEWLGRINDNFDELYGAGAAATASATQKGPVELATDAEAIAGADTTRAITPANLAAQQAKIVDWSFAGAAAPGACTLTGAAVGDKVLSVTGVAAGTVGNQAAKFESVITVVNQIQQSDAGNLAANIYIARLEKVA